MRWSRAGRNVLGIAGLSVAVGVGVAPAVAATQTSPEPPAHHPDASPPVRLAMTLVSSDTSVRAGKPVRYAVKVAVPADSATVRLPRRLPNGMTIAWADCPGRTGLTCRLDGSTTLVAVLRTPKRLASDTAVSVTITATAGHTRVAATAPRVHVRVPEATPAPSRPATRSPSPAPTRSGEPTPTASGEPAPTRSGEPTPTASGEPAPTRSGEPTPTASGEPTPTASGEPTPSRPATSTTAPTPSRPTAAARPGRTPPTGHTETPSGPTRHPVTSPSPRVPDWGVGPGPLPTIDAPRTPRGVPDPLDRLLRNTPQASPEPRVPSVAPSVTQSPDVADPRAADPRKNTTGLVRTDAVGVPAAALAALVGLGAGTALTRLIRRRGIGRAAGRHRD